MRDLHSTKASLARPYRPMSNAFTQFTQNHQPEKPFLTSAGGEVLATYADFETETGRYLDALSALCLLYTSPSPRDLSTSRMPSSA